jgi:tetratricopeptide (TPR) repeat protein
MLIIATVAAGLLAGWLSSRWIAFRAADGHAAVDALAALDTSSMEPRVAQAIDPALQAARAAPRSAASWGQLGMVLDAHAQWAAARAAYRRARDLAPDDFRWLYHLAVVESESGGDLQEAAALFEAAARLRPEYAPASYRLGELQLRLGRFEEAARTQETALRADPSLGQAHRERGRALLAAGRTADAVADLERARQLLPGDGPTLAALGQALQRDGQTQAAQELVELSRAAGGSARLPDALRQEVAVLAVSGAAFMERATALLAQGRFAEAVTALQTAIEVKPGDPYPPALLGAALLASERLAEAEAAFRRALELKPDLAEAHVGLGRLAMARGEMAGAVEHFEAALRAVPDHPEAHFKMAIAMVRLGRIDDALVHFDRGAGAAPAGPEDLVNWAIALLERKEYSAALERCRQAADLDPRYAKARFAMGYIHSRQGDHSQAIEQYRQALAIDTRYIEAYDQMAASLAALGREEEALVFLQRLLDFKPDHPVGDRMQALQRVVQERKASKAP